MKIYPETFLARFTKEQRKMLRKQAKKLKVSEAECVRRGLGKLFNDEKIWS